MAVPTPQLSRSFADTAIDFAPGVVLSAAVAGAAYLAAPYVAHVVPIPAMVLALVIGIALNPLASQPAVRCRAWRSACARCCAGRWRCWGCGWRSPISRRSDWRPACWSCSR